MTPFQFIFQTRLLVEGEAGMGKTFLATKLAEEWANGTHLQKFHLLFLVTLGDLLGSLQQYIMDELLPSYYEQEKLVFDVILLKTVPISCGMYGYNEECKYSSHNIVLPYHIIQSLLILTSIFN